MTFADLLGQEGLDLNDVALCLHKPSDPISRRALLTMVEDAPDLFALYQSTHNAIAEATLRGRAHLASFVATAPGELTFVGLSHRELGPQLTAEAILADAPFCQMLQRVGGHLEPLDAIAARLAGRHRFFLTARPALADLSRRLVVGDPGGRAYMRLAETTPLEVIEVKRTASVSPPMPSWDALTLNAVELRNMPHDWALRLSQWRGVYLITDEGDGARYVGAAYGADNLLGRWQQHIAGDQGITEELRRRDPNRFRFSILDLLAPTADVETVTASEQLWMARLHTKRFGLNR